MGNAYYMIVNQIVIVIWDGALEHAFQDSIGKHTLGNHI